VEEYLPDALAVLGWQERARATVLDLRKKLHRELTPPRQ